MILLACVLEEVKEKGDTQFLNYLVSLIHFLPFSAPAVLALSHDHVYQKRGEEEGVANAASCPTISLALPLLEYEYWHKAKHLRMAHPDCPAVTQQQDHVAR